MTTEERISEWMQGREDELVEALVSLIAAESTRSDAKPGKPFGEGPALALERAMELTNAGDSGRKIMKATWGRLI